MWIFCGGMNRSGSTLQFQLTAHLVEQAGRGKRVDWITPDEFPQLREKLAGQAEWKVFKTHRCTPEILAEFQAGNAKAVYIYRDVRDVIVSRINRTGGTFSGLWRGTLISILKNYRQWTSLDGVLISRYEDVVVDVAGEVRRIAAHLDIPISHEESQQVAAEYTPERQLARIQEAKQTGLVERSPKVAFDPVSNLHTNHIRSGKSKQWASVLTRRQVAQIESRAGSWLVANGYELSVPRWQRVGLLALHKVSKRAGRLLGARRRKGAHKARSA